MKTTTLSIVTIVALLASSCEESAPAPRTTSLSQKSPAGFADGAKDGEPEGDEKRTGDKPKKEDENEDKQSFGKENEKDGKNSDKEDEKDEPEDEEPAPEPVYPLMRYRTTAGVTTCDGDEYDTSLATDALLTTPRLAIKTTEAYIDCGGSCSGKANDKLQQTAIGTTSYERPTNAELQKAKEDDGLRLESSLVYAKSVTKNDGTVFTFDDYVPVYAFPQVAGAYAKLLDRPRTWETDVRFNGAAFHLVVEVSVKVLSGTMYEMHISNTIVGDTDGRFYEIFPSPRAQTYQIQTADRTISTLRSAHSWLDDENCANNSEMTVLDYKLCEKVKDGVTENFCP